MNSRLVIAAVSGVMLVLMAPAARAASPDDTAAAPAPSAASGERQEELDLFKDPAFRKQFLGSYGVLADYEPKVSPVERQELEKVLALMPTDPDAARAVAEAAAKPDASALIDFTLGNMYFQKDQPEPAADRYRLATAKFPSFRRAWKNLGLVSVRLGRHDEAIKALSRLIELGGGDGLSYGLLGYSYSATGQFVSAESAYRNAVLLQSDLLDWKLGLAQSLLKQRKYAETTSLCDELIERYPDRADFWLLQANAFIGLGQPLKAAEDFEMAARMGKATPQSLYTLGDIYANQSLYDLAGRAYARAIEAAPDQDLERPVRSVEILAQRDALPQSRLLLAKVRETFASTLDEAGRTRLLRLEARLAVADGQGGQAVESLEQIVAIDPLDGEALMLLGQHYGRANEIDRAIFYYERAESLEPFEADAKVRHAQLLVARSQYRDAVPLLKRAQELKPRDEVARYLEQVERIARAQ